MKGETTDLLRLLVREDTQRIIEALQVAPATESHLGVKVAISQQTANRRLNELKGWGIVGARNDSPAIRPTRIQGQHPRTWRLRGQEVVQFYNRADAFALELLELRTRRLGEELDDRRRNDLGVIEGEKSRSSSI
jgi:predicted ArsR family transcriptional regulator